MSNIWVIASRAEDHPRLRETVTVEPVRAHLADVVRTFTRSDRA